MPTMVQILGILIALAGLSVLLCAFERLFPSVRAQPLWRRGSNVDVLYWLLTPLVTRMVLRIVGFACVVIVFAALDRQVAPRLTEGFGPVASQPLWLLSMEMLLLGDLIGYWTHRWFHQRRLWKFHAVHHSSTRLDWLSALRVHPVNDVVSKLVPAVLLACLGFPLQVLAGYVALLTFYTILLHANLNWSYGPLRYVVASPLFHRWHHTTEEQGLNRNFALLFPFLDLLFGTFFMLNGERPERFGMNTTEVPETFLGQLLFPFRGDKTVGRGVAASPALEAPAARSFLDTETRNVRTWIEKLDTPRSAPTYDSPPVGRKRRAKRSAPVAVEAE
jgi:sterol desaturase/sphingolipid hydroxylase (fatty acid hydroxylase superfamily)